MQQILHGGRSHEIGGWLRVSTVNLDDKTVDHQTIMAQGSSVYMSAQSLLVSTSYWQPVNIVNDVRQSGSNHTFLHRFALNDSGDPSYTGSGTFAGRLINRFAIDETSDGTIRVAVSGRDSNNQTYSYLASLRNTDQKLTVVGKSDPIAPGETLRSARFVKDRAYLVTAIVIDPFFVFDMSDAMQPRKLGELKIPGFSSYLHPVGENHVLGIGFDDTGWPRRVKASLFNVVDPANPIEQSVLTLGQTYTGSDALWDPHAFSLYYPNPDSADAIMAIPVRSYRYSNANSSDESAIRLVNVRTDQAQDALTLRGSLDMSDLLQQDQPSYGGWRNTDARRAVFIDDTVYGISDAAVRRRQAGQPGKPRRNGGFPLESDQNSPVKTVCSKRLTRNSCLETGFRL